MVREERSKRHNFASHSPRPHLSISWQKTRDEKAWCNHRLSVDILLKLNKYFSINQVIWKIQCNFEKSVLGQLLQYTDDVFLDRSKTEYILIPKH